MNSQNLYQTRKIESVQDEQENLLTTVFESGQILKDYTMEEIRYKLHG
jgi:hypothetical protein